MTPEPLPETLRVVSVGDDGAARDAVPLGVGTVVCGRARGDLLLRDDPTVAPEHACFTVTADGLAVEDLGTESGTFLRLRDARLLRDGDELRAGHQRLRLDAAPPGARLVALDARGAEGERFELRDGTTTVGREAGEIRFPGDRYLSARHARLDVREGAVVVTDLGSRNGTFVRITGPAPVGVGDELLVGTRLLRIEA